MKHFLVIAPLAGLLCSCTEHVYPHRNTTVWQSPAPASRPVSSSSAAPAAHVTPYTPEVVEAVRAE
jgi:hypothetical protein